MGRHGIHIVKTRILTILLAVAVLSSSLVWAFGCRSRQDPPLADTDPPLDTTPADTETSTLVPAPSVPFEPLDSMVVAASQEALFMDGELLLDKEGLAPWTEETGYTISLGIGASPSSLTLQGWVGFGAAIDAFGYRLDGKEPVFSLFETPTEDSVREVGGIYARRYLITAPLFTLKAGAHTVEFLARLADGSIHPVLPSVTLLMAGLDTDLTVPYHASVTGLNEISYEGRGGNTEQGVDVIDASIDGITVNADCRLRINGWMAVEGGVDRYVWSPDGLTWYTAVSGSVSGEPSDGHFASLGFENAAENALMDTLLLDLSPCGGRLVWITLGAVPKDAPDRVVPFLTVTGLEVPVAPVDIPSGFYSDINNNPLGTDLRDSDLYDYFDISYGAGETRRVDLLEGQPCYLYEGIHSLQASVSGTFAISATVKSMGNASFLFVRGVKQMVSVDTVPILLTNFYETDGLGLCGGAGIYASLRNGMLTLVVKGLDPSAAYRIRNYVYEIEAAGEELTLTDDGITVRCYVDGVLKAEVTPLGSVDYPEHFSLVQPYAHFAKTATVRLADGRTDVIQNTLITATYSAQIGIAIRGGHVYFTELSVIPLAQFKPQQG